MLPELVRRLILATGHKPSLLDMPSGSSVNLPGWDGLLEIEEGNAWIPSGQSAWELSCEKGAKRKANSDYKKRTTESQQVSVSDTTFVFVTARRWAGKRQWAKKRYREVQWADVKALDASDLAAWLQQAPAVGYWFARIIGKLPDNGFVPMNEWWEHWSTSANPNISHQLVTAGRDEEVQRLGHWLVGEPGRFFVRGDTREEAIAFVAASAHDKPSIWGSTLLAKAIVVNSEEAWRSLESHSTSLVLVRNFSGDISSQIALDNGHHVLTPIDRLDDAKGIGCNLPVLDRNKTISALLEMGLSDEKSRLLIRKTARRLQIMRRFLIDESRGQLPGWVPRIPRALVPLVLVGQWEESSQADRALIEELLAQSYGVVESELVNLTVMSDAPLIKVGDRWRFVSHEEAWHLLAPRLTSSDVDRFRRIATSVLGTISPEFELPVGERYMAKIFGKSLPHSRTLIRGMARCLALMGTQSERAANARSVSLIPYQVVSNALDKHKDWRKWATLNRELPVLAEASPESLLNAVERDLVNRPTDLAELFSQEGGFLNEVNHTGLLWALERLAWSQDHFARVAKVLAQLSKLDPGGRTSNRPSESLSSMFLPPIRFSEVSDESRLDVLRMLLDTMPMSGWKLLIAAYSFSHRLVVHRHPPSWRPWAQDGVASPTVGECKVFLQELERLIMKHVGVDSNRWANLIEIISDLSMGTRREAIKLLSDHVGELQQHPKVNNLRNRLREQLHKCRSFPDARWGLASNDIETLDEVYRSLQPSDPIAAHAWLFERWPELPDPKPIDQDNASRTIAEREERVTQARQAAIREAYRVEGASALTGIGSTVEEPFQVGLALAREMEAGLSFDLTFDHLGSDNQNLRYMALGAFTVFFSSSGWTMLDEAIQKAKRECLGPQSLADIYIAAETNRKTWNRHESESLAVQERYWKSLQHLDTIDWSGTDFSFAVEQLISVQRSSIGVRSFAYLPSLPPEAAVRLLEALPSELAMPDDSHPFVDQLQVLHLFKKLDKAEGVGDGVVAKLEIQLYGMLERQRENLALHREVIRSPSLFADLVSWAFTRSDGQQDQSGDEQTRRDRGQLALRILWNLRAVPGDLEDGSIDFEFLTAWVSESRRMCRERDRGDIGDENIGQILANAPVGEDGIWPCEEVRHILDNLASSVIGNGFVVGKRNQRGVTSRDLVEGGIQERSIAAQYREDAATIAQKWPFTAALLGDLANSFESEGQLHDDRAKWTDQFES